MLTEPFKPLEESWLRGKPQVFGYAGVSFLFFELGFQIAGLENLPRHWQTKQY